MEKEVFYIGSFKIIVKKGDITEEKVDAIVNPANNRLEMGGGLAKVIKNKGGKIIEKEAKRKEYVKQKVLPSNTCFINNFHE